MVARTVLPSASFQRAVGCFASRLTVAGPPPLWAVYAPISRSRASCWATGRLLLELVENVPSGCCPGIRMPRACSYATVMPCAHQPSTPCVSTSQAAICGCVQELAFSASSSSCHCCLVRPVAATSFSSEMLCSETPAMRVRLSRAGDRQEVVHRELLAALGGGDAGGLENR